MKTFGWRETAQLMCDHYRRSPSRFPLAYYRMKAIAHRYELVAADDDLFYKGNRVWSFAFRGEIRPEYLEGVDLLYVLESKAPLRIPGFELIGSGYRLFHHTLELGSPAIINVDIAEAQPVEEADEIADVLNRCYAVNTFGPEKIIDWTNGSAYCPSLWLWAIDSRNGEKAGLFITDFDPEINEANFDWIQLLPEYRGQRIGEALMAETFSRLRGKAEIVYVGTLNEQAAKFYRKCGFAGEKALNFKRIGARMLSYQEACISAG